MVDRTTLNGAGGRTITGAGDPAALAGVPTAWRGRTLPEAGALRPGPVETIKAYSPANERLLLPQGRRTEPPKCQPDHPQGSSRFVFLRSGGEMLRLALFCHFTEDLLGK